MVPARARCALAGGARRRPCHSRGSHHHHRTGNLREFVCAYSTTTRPMDRGRCRPFLLLFNWMLRHLLLITLLLAAALCFAKDKSKDRFLPPGPIHVDKAGQKWVDKTLRKMSPEDKVGQLFSIWVLAQFLNDADPIWMQLRDNVRKYHIGLLVLSVPHGGPILL